MNPSDAMISMNSRSPSGALSWGCAPSLLRHNALMGDPQLREMARSAALVLVVFATFHVWGLLGGAAAFVVWVGVVLLLRRLGVTKRPPNRRRRG